jgi:hypothetical protein
MGMLFNVVAHLKQMKPPVREFLRTLQRLLETKMGKTTSHILHVETSTERCWVHPKIVFTKPKNFFPSCYLMKEWTDMKN